MYSLRIKIYHTVILQLLLLGNFIANSQNLVINCSFEEVYNCPTGSDQLGYAKDWIIPGEGTPDLVHDCNSNNVGIPGNLWGYQYAHTGNAYANIICYSKLSSVQQYREYITGTLDCKLIKGKVYDISFFISCADKSHYAIDGIGAYLSADIPTQNGNNNDEVINTVGYQLISVVDGFPADNKQTWVKIEGEYTALGGEKYITVGNFKYNDELTLYSFNNWEANIAAYYIDDVSVIPREPMINLGPDTVICPGDSVTFNIENICNSESLSWENGSTELIRSISEPGTYSISGQIGCSNFYDEVTISFPPDPGFYLPTDTVICPNRTIEIIAEGSYTSYLWQDGSTQQSYITDQEGIYWLTVETNYGCSYTDSIAVQALTEPVFSLGQDTVICLGQMILLDPGIDSSFHHFEWNDGSNEISRIISDSGYYWLRVSNPCGEMTDHINISTLNCDAAFKAPNAFSPNSDGRNDIFMIRAENINNFRLFIYDRWGTLLFQSDRPDHGWDGTFKGKPVTAGNYFWVATYHSGVLEGEGKKVETGGSILLLR
jgi:gliding motility-associated-like protein